MENTDIFTRYVFYSHNLCMLIFVYRIKIHLFSEFKIISIGLVVIRRTVSNYCERLYRTNSSEERRSIEERKKKGIKTIQIPGSNDSLQRYLHYRSRLPLSLSRNVKRILHVITVLEIIR